MYKKLETLHSIIGTDYSWKVRENSFQILNCFNKFSVTFDQFSAPPTDHPGFKIPTNFPPFSENKKRVKKTRRSQFKI
jgi:hypothetical protein